MPFPDRSQPSFLKGLMSRIPSFSKTGRYSLQLLNVTQFLGVINDNVFKFVMAFLLIDFLGKDQASAILAATGAVYVIPFLLFSSSAGILADRFSKQKLLVIIKGAEILIMLFAVFAFHEKTILGCYILLFFLATHSAMFGPSKYGIIPELVAKNTISRANGLITSFTYLAIIIGTFLASFLTEITERHFTLIALFCLFIAICGFITSFFIKETVPQGSQKQVNIFFFREIYKTLVDCSSQDHLLPAIFGSAFFLFIGAFTQLNIIPFALQSLNLPEVAGGYLFLTTSLGIAFGAFLGGKLCRNRIELGLSCLSSLGIAFFFILLFLFSHHLIPVIICLLFIGTLGGMFIVPFDTFIQVNSSNAKRGQTIAAANFLSFGGVFIASIALFIFSQIFDLSSANGFALIGVITLFIGTVLSICLSNFAIPYFCRKIIYRLTHFKRPETAIIEKESSPLLILEKGTLAQAFLLLGSLPNIHLIVPSKKRSVWTLFLNLFYSIHIIEEQQSFADLISSAKAYQTNGVIPCIFLQNSSPSKSNAANRSFLDLFKRSSQIFSVKFNPKTETSSASCAFERQEL